MDLSETFDWKGRRIACGRSGSGPAVVFCHGTPWSSHLWRPFAEALAADYTVHLWDMPGYGRSSKDAGHAVDFGVQAEAFTALLEHWGLDRPHVVAHDYGGAVSLRAHLVHEVAFASLLMTDVVAVPPAGSPFFRLVAEHPDVLTRLPPYIHEAVMRAYIGDAAHRELREDELTALVAPWLGEEGQAAFYRQIAAYDEAYLAENEALLGRVAVPVSILWGREDGWIPPATGERLAAGIPGAAFRLVDEAGHLIQLDAPVALATALRTWLDRVSA
ncbi:alpha/beta fold hydrolase [Phytomonospora endophytica]|uniref:Pimeloyl-ACP methyl ester carboxylesterase n=1 Tax=Phytomonospora endophytica TaxID=714109 RepID=A0A841F944_9ACTN|nr:alpha/beta hydrolase [Phytomonospora endophytica]MBB6033671.1 pimeloyl-ACP methyl ester carboxylesterase [Phytomonospora endophytica]GIG64812.1 oxidoreductase [Phytomonospora endophytica]